MPKKSIEKKQIVEIIGGIVIAVVLFWVVRNHSSYNSQLLPNGITSQSYKVLGEIADLTNPNVIEINGTKTTVSDAAKADYSSPKNYSVTISQGTRYVKTIWHLPSKATLAKNNYRFDPSKVTKTQEAGSFYDLKRGMEVTAQVDSNLSAKEIDYQAYVYGQ